jgi:hypothetical protein
MGLERMGVAGSIVSLTIGLTFGSIAIALAIAFGFAGREAAKQMIEKTTGGK